MAGHGTDSRVGRHASRVRPHTLQTYLHPARTLFLLATFSGFLGADMLVAGPLAAQAITGTLVEAGTGAPIEGASVVLLNRSGDEVTWRLTDAAGRFYFQMDRGGTYLLRADRIGHASVVSDPIPVDRGVTAVYQLEAPVEAIMLTGIDVRTSRRCEVRPGPGMSTATVWEEARKALEATSRTSGLGRYRYVIRHYERELDARGRRVVSEQSQIQRATMSSPFRSVNVETLLEQGFIRPDGEETLYFAPDADILLSDPFLDTHCMSLTSGRGEAEGLLGLSFEPTQDRGVPDISGVLWLDPENGELQWLDYRYEFLDVPNAERLGGMVRFEGLPNGTWIVREWYIRMPLLEATRRQGRRTRIRLVGIREEGSLVLSVNNQEGDLVLDSSAGIIEGVVLESEGSAPVEHVVVLLDDETRATTDENGRFRFTGLAEGYYGLRVFNPALDAFGLSPEPVFLEVGPGEVTAARLRWVSLDSVMTEKCSSGDFSTYDGILAGFALDEAGDPRPGARVWVDWEEVGRRVGSLGVVYKELATTGRPDDGFFLMCGVPRDRSVDITVEWNGIESRPVRFLLSGAQRVSRRDVTIRGDR